MELKLKMWLVGGDEDSIGGGAFGDGRYHLLREIGRQGSLRKAAERLGISYRKAWGDVRSAERHLGFELITRHRGGRGGGTSVLTERAKELLEAYSKTKAGLEKMAQKQYEKRLKPLLP